jgi:YidC/Oxa1 family membrane protein insertase
VIKKLKFNDDNYLINMNLIVKNNSDREIHILPEDSLTFSWSGLGIPIKNYSFIVQEMAFNSGKIVRKNIVSSQRKEAEGAISWCSLLSKYFLVAFIPTMNFTFHKVNFINELETTKMIAKLPTIKLLPSCNYKTSVTIYAGPIRYQNLKAIAVKSDAAGIEKLAGMNILSRIILGLLNFFYQFTRNYGIAIILLTVVIKIVLYPLSLKSLKAMRQMQKLQPLLTKLKEKYKNNKEALNREMLLLYKRHKVNPFGGCLPLLLQLPIFFALYATLTKAIELRCAEFVFWIKDLSVKDPYFVLPILMGITMFLQQKLTPHYESTQTKFMYILPIFFTFIFMSFPAGLVLYWLMHNILSIAEQKFLMKKV